MVLTSCRRKWCGDDASSSETGVRVFLDEARPHTAAATVNHIATFGWERLDQAPYSSELAPSDFHFFPILRTLEERRFTTNEDAEAAVRTMDTDFY
jgi:hypothetical protein